MIEQKVNRRFFCQVLGSGLYVLGSTMAWGNSQESEAGPPDIIVRRNYSYGRFYFDPAGLYVQPGTTIRWENDDWGFTVTAFHPSNDNHELRIPENAQPFDSGLMIAGDSFEWKFDQEGTYDYFSRYHETIGGVARIVVGRPGGPRMRRGRPLPWPTLAGRSWRRSSLPPGS